MSKAVSHAIWPTGTFPADNDHTMDTHDTDEQAFAVIDALCKKGAGGDDLVFPLRVYVTWAAEKVGHEVHEGETPEETKARVQAETELKAALACVRNNSILNRVALYVDELQRQLKVAQDIQHVEKKLLLQEIGEHTATKKQLEIQSASLKAALEKVEKLLARLQVDPGGSDRIDELESAASLLSTEAAEGIKDTKRLDHILQFYSGWHFNQLTADTDRARGQIDTSIKQHEEQKHG